MVAAMSPFPSLKAKKLLAEEDEARKLL